jgi:sn-glycerol 3-phosphate transport system ATP-binding protein
MGRAIVREPAAFLFDEPLSNLDAKLRVEMRGEIRLLQRRLGTTSVYVTHDQLEAMTLADRLVVLNGGRIEQIGAPLEVYRQPASIFVASFIGSPAMNLIPAECDGRSIRIGEAAIELGDRRVPAGAVTVGLRAEDVKLRKMNGSAFMPLTIAYVEELGSERLVHGDHDDTRVVVAVPSDYELEEVMDIEIDPLRLHLFDTGSGKRI